MEVALVPTPPALDANALAAEVARLRPLAELGRMAATVAHEIRNPLAGISANAELLREGLADPADVESVDIILNEVDRLAQLVTDLLYYSRERPADARPLDLGFLARSACELSHSTAADAGITLIHVGQGRALGDSDLGKQALLNVIRNAIQATPKGGRIEVRASEGIIDVVDTGAGVPEPIRATLFQPFVTGRTRGLGLGATVAQRCQQRQGGDLALHQTGPEGSVFRLSWATQPDQT
jgi:signal transduction histidine kinase